LSSSVIAARRASGGRVALLPCGEHRAGSVDSGDIFATDVVSARCCVERSSRSALRASACHERFRRELRDLLREPAQLELAHEREVERGEHRRIALLLDATSVRSSAA
jgi:hypothetical protein